MRVPLPDTRVRPVVRAAGAVVTRPGHEVLLVHRPRYDDWSFPKGKVDPGEHVLAAAVREVEEETGLRVRLGLPLAQQRYEVSGPQGRRDKTVAYWSARVQGDDDVSAYVRPGEIDAAAWVHRDEAAERLTYPYDRATLAEAWSLPRRTGVLVVLRHGESRPRSGWRGPDPLRPLVDSGHEQAERWAAPLAAYGPDRVLSSPSTRCTQTVVPYARAAGLPVEEVPGLSEEHAAADVVEGLCAELLARRTRALLCSHRPVLPIVWKVLGLPDPRLEKGEALVVHHRGGTVLATEVQAV